MQLGFLFMKPIWYEIVPLNGERHIFLSLKKMSQITIDDESLKKNTFKIRRIYHLACEPDNPSYVFVTLITTARRNKPKGLAIELIFNDGWTYKILGEMSEHVRKNVRFSKKLKADLKENLNRCIANNGVWE